MKPIVFHGRRTLRSVLAALLLLSFCGCVTRPQRSNIREVETQLILFGPVSWPDPSQPAPVLQALCGPIRDTQDSNVVWLPKGLQIIRLDQEPARALDIQDRPDPMLKLLGKSATFGQLRKTRFSALRSKAIYDRLTASSNTRIEDPPTALSHYVEGNGKSSAKVVLVGSNTEAFPSWFTTASANTGGSAAPVVVAYWEGARSGQNATNPPSVLASRIEAANTSIGERASEHDRVQMAKETVETFEGQVSDDPFAMYALSKTIIYGEEHHEAFELLEKAARLAIKKGRAAELYGRISSDLEADEKKGVSERTIWRLSTGHPHHWLPLIRALTSNDEKLLHED